MLNSSVKIMVDENTILPPDLRDYRVEKGAGEELFIELFNKEILNAVPPGSLDIMSEENQEVLASWVSELKSKYSDFEIQAELGAKDIFESIKAPSKKGFVEYLSFLPLNILFEIKPNGSMLIFLPYDSRENAYDSFVKFIDAYNNIAQTFKEPQIDISGY